MALLAPYEKFIKDISDIVERKYGATDRSVTIGDIRADIRAKIADVEDDGDEKKVDVYGNTEIKLYYTSPDEEVIPTDEKFGDVMTERFKEGKVTRNGEAVEKVTVEYDSPWVYVGGYPLGFDIYTIVQVLPNGKTMYYFEDGFKTVIASPRNPQVYEFVLSSEEKLGTEHLMRIITFFTNSTSPDINILERMKAKEVLQASRGRDVGGVIGAYTFGF